MNEIKTTYIKFFSAKVYAGILLGLLIGSVVTTFFGYKTLKKTETVGDKNNFYSDELLLFGNDTQGKRFYSSVSLNRKSELSAYTHYYFSKFNYGGIKHEEYSELSSAEAKVIPNGFLVNYENKGFSDLSARENIKVNYKIKDQYVSADVFGLNADFIVKNTLEYTKYVSVGEAMVKVGSDSFKVNAALVKIYSSDASKYLFFDGYDQLVSDTVYMQLWDKDGNFFLIDNSDVLSSQSNYTSHTWVLYKDKQTGAARKFFEANISVKRNPSGKLDKVEVSLPGLNKNTYTLIPEEVFSKQDEFIVKGDLEGQAYLHHYSPGN